MKEHEAIKHLKEITGWTNFWGGCYKEKLSAIEKAMEALKKQIPKTTKESILGVYCSECKHFLDGTEYYCSFCGQKIDWSVENEEH